MQTFIILTSILAATHFFMISSKNRKLYFLPLTKILQNKNDCLPLVRLHKLYTIKKDV